MEKLRKPIRVAIFLGSKSDLSQCVEGLKIFRRAIMNGSVEIVRVVERGYIIINSIHRHHQTAVINLKKLVAMGVDVIVVGAGKAAQLPGMLESILRYEMRDNHVRIIAVAFKGKTRKSNQAALRSIDEVPGNQMIFTVRHHGRKGFTAAIRKAIKGEFPEIILPKEIPDEYFTLNEAITFGETIYQEA